MAFCQFQNTTSNGVVSSVFTMKKNNFIISQKSTPKGANLIDELFATTFGWSFRRNKSDSVRK